MLCDIRARSLVMTIIIIYYFFFSVLHRRYYIVWLCDYYYKYFFFKSICGYNKVFVFKDSRTPRPFLSWKPFRYIVHNIFMWNVGNRIQPVNRL